MNGARPMAAYAYAQDIESKNAIIEEVGNGYILTLMEDKQEERIGAEQQFILGALKNIQGPRDHIMDPIREAEDSSTIPESIKHRTVKVPVRYVCKDMEEVIFKIGAYFRDK